MRRWRKDSKSLFWCKEDNRQLQGQKRDRDWFKNLNAIHVDSFGKGTES